MAVTERPGHPGSSMMSCVLATVLGGVTTRPLSVLQDVAVPEGTLTALTFAVAALPGASEMVPFEEPTRVAWMTWAPDALVPATPGNPPVTHGALEVFLKLSWTIT